MGVSESSAALVSSTPHKFSNLSLGKLPFTTMFNPINTVCKYITEQQTFHSKIRGRREKENKRTVDSR